MVKVAKDAPGWTEPPLLDVTDVVGVSSAELAERDRVSWAARIAEGVKIGRRKMREQGVEQIRLHLGGTP